MRELGTSAILAMIHSIHRHTQGSVTLFQFAFMMCSKLHLSISIILKQGHICATSKYDLNFSRIKSTVLNKTHSVISICSYGTLVGISLLNLPHSLQLHGIILEKLI